MDDAPITRTRMPEAARLGFIPKHVGVKYLMAFENMVYDVLKNLSSEYDGGLWQFYELSNGGFYMAPDLEQEQIELRVDGNGYEGRMSTDAAGIVATLFALSHLSLKTMSVELGEKFHLLRDYADQHPEASEIFAAID